jgi:hypothetical protein
MRKLKHVQLFNKFNVNESVDELREEIKNLLLHYIDVYKVQPDKLAKHLSDDKRFLNFFEKIKNSMKSSVPPMEIKEMMMDILGTM